MATSEVIATRIIEERPLLLDRFKVLRILGEGAAGAVYLVEDRKNNNARVALKVLVNKEAFDEHTCKRFHAEWQVSRELRHSNLVEAYDLIKLNDALAFTMEYVEGGDLRQLITNTMPDWSRIDTIFIQLLDALEYLHKHNLYHRDIKLENIMLTYDGKVKLSDLGLMKLTADLHNNGHKLTKTGILLGTAQYMPPEYIINSQYDHCSDIYAVGIVLYEILNGERWLAEKSGNEVISHLIKTHFEFPEIRRIALPDKYKFILRNCLRSKSHKRFQSAAELKSVFQKPLEDGLWKQSEPITVNKKEVCVNRGRNNDQSEEEAPALSLIRRPTIFATLGLGALLAVAGVATTIYSWQSRVIDLPAGTYQGTIVDYSTQSEKVVQLQVGPVGAVLSSGNSVCRNGFISLKDRTLTCGDKTLWVSGSHVPAGTEIKVFSWLGQMAIIKIKKIN